MPLALLLFLFLPAFVNVVLVFAAWGAKHGVGTLCHKRFITVLADTKRFCFIRYHETQHHLYAEHQLIKVPNNRRIV